LKSHSLTRRLILLVLLIELGAAVCVSVTAYIYERHTHLRTFDVMLRGRADSLLGAVQDAEDAADNVMLDGSQAQLPKEDLYLVQDDTGRVIGQSSSWPGVDSLTPDHHGLRHHRDDEHDVHRTASQNAMYFRTIVGRENYRVLRIEGLRVVDPGEKNGGTRRIVTLYYGSSTRQVWGAILQSVEFYAGINLVVLLITGLLMAWVLNRSLVPLRGLASAAERVSVASWTFTPPDGARETEELQPLVHALETLLAGLQLSFEKQRRFVGDAAHELKTSVAVVKSSLQLVDMKPRTQQEYQTGLARCIDDCMRIEALVAQMLTLARIEESAEAQQSRNVSELFQAIEATVIELDTVAQLRGVRIDLPGASSLISSTGAVALPVSDFKLLCSNLLLNAIQHSPENSTIRIEAAVLQHMLQFEIRDRGDGIIADDLPRIFDRFARGDPSRSRNTGGIGLGLAICKAIVDRHDGTIEIISEPETGTIVVVRFPLLSN
jgi:signal transduction histidine kinase